MSQTEDVPEQDSVQSPARKWRVNLLLFLLTVASVFVTGVLTLGESAPGDTQASTDLTSAIFARDSIVRGAQFAGTLLVILVAHELGHYVAARLHKVEASLPYFIPLPLLSPFGTMGAVIRMRGVIPTRRALLDIGASGPLAGLCFAIPLYIYGAAHSRVIPAVTPGTGAQLGESILLKVLDHAFAPAVPEGMDLLLSPIAFGAWGGMFVTMINLLPVGQLDGGHVAYALFGPRQDRYARIVHQSMLALFFVAVLSPSFRDVANGLGLRYVGEHLANSLFWLVWFQVLAILGTLSGERPKEPVPGTLTVRARLAIMLGLTYLASAARDNRSPILLLTFVAGLALLIAMEIKGGVLRNHNLLAHPPTGAVRLDSARTVIAVVTLLFFVLLFMPQPFSM